jgi:hypothetical protein
VLLYTACYVMWAVLSALGLYVAIVWRAVVIDLAPRISGDRWAISLADKVAVILLMLTWLVFVIVQEANLREAVVRNRLWSRAGKVLLVEVVLIIAAYAVGLLQTVSLGSPG